MAAMASMGCPETTVIGDSGVPAEDVGMRSDDVGTTDDARIPPDAGPPEPCSTPGAVENVACGQCGTVERFCSASGTWAYGLCEDEGECAPGTTDTIECGNCGTQMARCTIACMWESVGACTGEGECPPGLMTRSGEGCAAGETRDVVCNDECSFEPTSMCERDECMTPGATERVSCGTMCGTVERFCSVSGSWEYGTCDEAGMCVPGSTGTQPCGMCGTLATRCTTACAWETTGACMAEGECVPDATRVTSMGCPGGQVQSQRCSATCGWESTGACTTRRLIDVMLLIDITGSRLARVSGGIDTIRTRLFDALVGIEDVAVGVSFYADFPMSSSSATREDRPFEAGVEPSLMAATAGAELAGYPRTRSGGDGAESGIEALSVLAGGPVPASASALTCSSGRVPGGCWRADAQRVIVVWTDAPNHHGPLATGDGLEFPYDPAIPGAAMWTTESALGRMRTEGILLLVLMDDAFGRPQHVRMISDLGQPASDLIDVAAGTSGLGTGLDAVVARVRGLAAP